MKDLLGASIGLVTRSRRAGEHAAGGEQTRMVYKVVVTFSGVATLEMEADTPEEVRRAAKVLTVADMARAGQTDILSFQVAAREIVPVGEHAPEDESAAHKPRPSGWHRPL
jgi:hypothetical protein